MNNEEAYLWVKNFVDRFKELARLVLNLDTLSNNQFENLQKAVKKLLNDVENAPREAVDKFHKLFGKWYWMDPMDLAMNLVDFEEVRTTTYFKKIKELENIIKNNLKDPDEFVKKYEVTKEEVEIIRKFFG